MTNEAKKGLSPLTQIVLSMLSLSISVGSLATAYLAFQNSRYVSAREDSRLASKRKIFLTGELQGNELAVHPTDTDKRILNFMVQYPVGAVPHDDAPTFITLGGGLITVDDVNGYLWKRFRELKRIDKLSEVASAALPIIIYTKYTFEGEEINDRSLYYMFYLLRPGSGSVLVVPQNITYCGRLRETDPQVNFLLDSWITTAAGYDDRPSHAILFGCDSRNIWWVKTEKGRYELETDVAADTHKRSLASIPMAPGSLRLRSLSGTTEVKYWLSEMDSSLLESPAQYGAAQPIIPPDAAR